MRLFLLCSLLVFSLSGHSDFVDNNGTNFSYPGVQQVKVLTDRYRVKNSAFGFKNQEIRIGIIDTGYNDKEAPTKIKLCKSGHYNFRNDTSEVAAAHPHGTAVAAIIAEELGDINYCAVIYQVVGPRGLTTDTIKRAFQMAKNEGLVAINLSVSGRTYSFHERRAIKQTADRGTIIFAAAGNEKNNLDLFCNAFPACYPIPNMYVVGATERNNTVPAAYSNYGGRIHIWLPGDFDMNGEIVEGTSFAAPRALADYVYSLYLVQVGK